MGSWRDRWSVYRACMDLSVEQSDAVRAAGSGASLCIWALAGTGKTTTLRSIQAHYPCRSLYLAFNAAAAASAREIMGPDTEAMTGHSLAARHVFRNSNAYRAKFDRCKGVLSYRDFDPFLERFPQEQRAVAYSGIRDALQQFLYSSDQKVRFAHLPAGLTVLAGSDGLVEDIVDAAQDIWNAMRDEYHGFPLTHDGYFKLFQLRAPALPYGRILLDEAQDSNSAMEAFLRSQRAQIVAAGDPHQAIYRFRNCVDVLSRLPFPVRLLTGSWRFGHRIAEAGNKILELLDVPAKKQLRGLGPGGKTFDDSRPTTIIGRNNADVFDAATRILQQAPGSRLCVERLDQLVKEMASVDALQRGDREGITDPRIRMFKDFETLEEFAKATHSSDLTSILRRIENIDGSVPELLGRLRRAQTPAADTRIMTAHVAKGQQFDQVEMHGFEGPAPADGAALEIEAEELRLMYVAATRARISLRGDTATRAWINQLRLARQKGSLKIAA